MEVDNRYYDILISIHHPLKTNWTEVFENIVVNQNIVAKDIKRRQFTRKRKLDEARLPASLAPLLQ